MWQIFIASIKAATSSIAMFWFIMILRSPIPNFSEAMLIGISVSTLFIWILSFIFTIIFLVPLRFVFIFGSRGFSILIFTAIGFIIPALMMLWFSAIPERGEEMPALYKSENQRVIAGILAMGIVGATSAVVAWLSLKGSGLYEKT